MTTIAPLVTDEYLTTNQKKTDDDAIDQVRDYTPREDATLYYLYVTDGEELIGVVSLRELLNADVSQHVGDVMHEDVLTVGPEDSLTVVADRMAEENYPALPVVGEGQLVGVLRGHDVLHEVEDQETLSALRKAGFWID